VSRVGAQLKHDIDVAKQRITFIADGRVDNLFVEALREHGFDVGLEAASVATEQLAATRPDLLVIDLASTSEGIELLKKVRSSAELKGTLVMVIAPWGTGQATLALSHGADAFEPKPIDALRLIGAVERILRPQMVMTAVARED